MQSLNETLTTTEYQARQNELESRMSRLAIGSEERNALLAESNRLHEERQAILRAERKALREQVKALQKRIDELTDEIW